MELELMDFHCNCGAPGAEYHVKFEMTEGGYYKIRQLVCAACDETFTLDDYGCVKELGMNREENDD